MTETVTKSIIQPFKLANKNGELHYQWKVEDFPRLQGLLFSMEGAVKLDLNGYQDDRKRCLVNARIVANVQLECQTSFEPIGYEIDTELVYCVVSSEEQIAQLDDQYEALLVEEGQVDIKQVIEDELILSLPIIANKAAEDTDVKMTYGTIIEEAEEKKNPFEVLKELELKK